MQRFRTIGDGVTWEQVSSGHANQPINDGAGGGVNALRASGTLGIALRKYTEGAGYTQTQMPDLGELYFRAEPEMVPGTYAVRADILSRINAATHPYFR